MIRVTLPAHNNSVGFCSYRTYCTEKTQASPRYYIPILGFGSRTGLFWGTIVSFGSALYSDLLVTCCDFLSRSRLWQGPPRVPAVFVRLPVLGRTLSPPRLTLHISLCKKNVFLSKAMTRHPTVAQGCVQHFLRSFLRSQHSRSSISHLCRNTWLLSKVRSFAQYPNPKHLLRNRLRVSVPKKQTDTAQNDQTDNRPEEVRPVKKRREKKNPPTRATMEV